MDDSFLSLSAAVCAALRAASERAILPRFRRLGAGDCEEKSPREWVTVADRESEEILAARLTALVPGARVVGEEAASADPRLLDGLGCGAAWVVDPLDGTSNFIAGRPEFAVMCALLLDGETAGAWVFQPVRGTMWDAGRGAGTRRDGELVRCPVAPDDRRTAAADLRGAVLTRFLPPGVKERVTARASTLRECLPGVMCAGIEYPRVIEGDQDFALFWRTLPWDHAPGALLVQEAGGRVARPDGRAYRPADGGSGLLVASGDAAWRAAREALFAEDGSSV